MPQLDISTYLSQLFWFIVFFFLLYLVLSCTVLSKIEGVIKKRYEIIDRAICNASSFCTIAGHEIENQKHILQKTQLEVSKITSDAMKKAELLESNMGNLLSIEAVKVLALVDEEIGNYKVEVYDQLVETAITIAAIYYRELVNSDVKDYGKLKIVTNSLFKEGLL